MHRELFITSISIGVGFLAGIFAILILILWLTDDVDLSVQNQLEIYRRIYDKFMRLASPGAKMEMQKISSEILLEAPLLCDHGIDIDKPCRECERDNHEYLDHLAKSNPHY